jgi:hypothetical protein
MPRPHESTYDLTAADKRDLIKLIDLPMTDRHNKKAETSPRFFDKKRF